MNEKYLNVGYEFLPEWH